MGLRPPRCQRAADDAIAHDTSCDVSDVSDASDASDAAEECKERSLRGRSRGGNRTHTHAHH